MKVKQKRYDVILFENAYQLENHYKDLELLALMLQNAGYNVAIADVFKEEKLCTNNNIPHVQLRHKAPKVLCKVSQYRCKISNIRYSYLRLISNIYLIYALYSLKKQTRLFYLGSLTIDTPLLWLLFLPRNNNYLIWGLRSYVLLKWQEKAYGRFYIYSRLLYKLLRKSKYINFVVSNSIIKNEFIEKVGIDENRIVVRPERWVPDDYKINIERPKETNILKLLTFGTLRKNKHVEIVLDALKNLCDNSIQYTIAGRCKDDNGYSELLEERMKNVPNVIRIDRYIADEEYEELLDKTDFVVLCDEPEKSCGTNGTMLEAILHGIPVIAPHHEPFVTEIEGHQLGLTYDLLDVDSLSKCILIAQESSKDCYTPSILSYIDTLKIDSISKTIKYQLQNKSIL